MTLKSLECLLGHRGRASTYIYTPRRRHLSCISVLVRAGVNALLVLHCRSTQVAFREHDAFQRRQSLVPLTSLWTFPPADWPANTAQPAARTCVHSCHIYRGSTSGMDVDPCAEDMIPSPLSEICQSDFLACYLMITPLYLDPRFAARSQRRPYNTAFGNYSLFPSLWM